MDFQMAVMFSKWPRPTTPILAVDFKFTNHVIISSIATICDLLATSGACTVVFFQAWDANFAVVSFTAVCLVCLTRNELAYVTFQRFKDKGAVIPICV
jgi:hypothetical protein